MKTFDDCFNALIKNEGGYVNNPDDPGGETNFGITKRVAEENGYSGSMEDFTIEQARAIYKKLYWPDLFDQLPDGVAFQIFDAEVNHGPQTGIKMIQKNLNLPVDGIFGPHTLATCCACDPSKLILRFNATRLQYYTSLNHFDTFGKGWVNRVANNMTLGGE